MAGDPRAGSAWKREERREATVTRGRVVLLGLLAALLVSGPEAVPASAPATSPVAAAAAASTRSQDIDRKLAQLNPDMSQAEVERIRRAVVRYSEKYHLDPLLVTAVIEVESHAQPWARSPKGAQGLMQVMPYMMRPMGMAGNPSTIEANIEAGCMILASNIRRLGEADGISAYFWGSEIRGVSYLKRVRAARERLRREIQS
jgi:soluble lytic murein transglycosylase-like protein